MKVCSIEGCEKKVAARGWCGAHWVRWRKYGDPLGSAPRAIRPETCTIADCGNPTHARDWCSMHYSRWRIHGDPLAVVRIKIPKSGNCSIDCCENSIYAHGLCRGHYGRRARHGEPQADKPLWPKHPKQEECSIGNCTLRPVGRGLCSKHWSRWRKYGDPLGLASYSTPSDWERFWEKVDKNGPNGCWLWTGRLDPTGYGQFAPTFGKESRAHRYCYAQFVGPIPDCRPVIDHKCRVRSCVNPDHLRAVTYAQNSQNLTNRVGTASGRRGVTQAKSGKWFGRVVTNGRQFNTAQFETIAEAHEAVSRLRRELFTHSEEDWQEQPGSGDQLRQLVSQKVSNA